MDLKSALENAYSQAKGLDSLPRCPEGFEFSMLSAPEDMLWYLNGDKQMLREQIFGIGGFEYIDRIFQKKRTYLRISYRYYQEMGVPFPPGATDRIESLSQMEYGDALDAWAVIKP